MAAPSDITRPAGVAAVVVTTVAATVPGSGEDRRVFLKDRAYELLKTMILGEQFPPGSFLSERTLADTLGMSKTPVRSAVERLENEGFVSVSPQQGIVVRALSPEEIRNHFDLRIALETFVVRRLTGTLKAEQLAQLEAKLRDHERALETGDVLLAASSDLDFHLTLCRLGDNEEIVRALWWHHDILFRTVHKLYRDDRFSQRVQQNSLEHETLLKLLSDRDGDRAARYLEKHIEFSKHLILMG